MALTIDDVESVARRAMAKTLSGFDLSRLSDVSWGVWTDGECFVMDLFEGDADDETVNMIAQAWVDKQSGKIVKVTVYGILID